MKKMLKDDVIKQSTYNNYICRLNQLKEWNESLSDKIVYIYQFNRAYLENFLEHIYLDRDTTPKTRNNYLNWLSSVCSWMKGTGYIQDNPVENISKLREKDKFRKALDESDMKKLSSYLSVNDKYYLLACLMHYYTLVRPNELTYVRINDINVHNQTLFISSTLTDFIILFVERFINVYLSSIMSLKYLFNHIIFRYLPI